MADNVNHPSHYETGKFECIDVMVETQGIEATQAFCACNAFKYLYRHGREYDNFEDMFGDFVEEMLASEDVEETPEDVNTLDKMAAELYATYTAFIKAGFSKEQAFDLLIAVIE